MLILATNMESQKNMKMERNKKVEDDKIENEFHELAKYIDKYKKKLYLSRVKISIAII